MEQGLNTVTPEVIQKTGFFLNPWVITVGGSILSGLVVAWVSNKLFFRKDDKRYSEKTIAANREVLYALRPLIPEAAFPSVNIVDSLISATARKYQIKKENMNSPMQFFDELIKEVMDSSFVPNKKKTEYTKNLFNLKAEALSLTQPRTYPTGLETSAVENKERMGRTISLLTGTMATITAIILTLAGKNEKLPSLSLPFLNNFLVPIGGALLASLVALTFMKKEENQNKSFRKLLMKIFDSELESNKNKP